MSERKPYTPPKLTLLGRIEDLLDRDPAASSDPPIIDAKARAKEFIDKMLERFGEHQLERIEASWFRQSREERRARLRVVTALVLELEKIRKVTIHATAIGEGAIGAVIEGDWKDVAGYADDLSWSDEPDCRRLYGELWAPFVTILRTELRRRSTN